MSKIALTPTQEAAAYAEYQNVWLTAGAGSGKTRVLTERILYLHLEKGMPLHRILAITFTEKAAEEMRVRLGSRLAEMGARDSLRAIPEAAITTIDAFCMRLIQEYGDAVGVDPRFRILDPVESAEWEAEVWAEVLDRWWRERRDDAMALFGALPLSIGPSYPGGVDGSVFWSLLRKIHTAGADLDEVDFRTPDLDGMAESLWAAVSANARGAQNKMRGTPAKTREKLQEITRLAGAGELPESERWALLTEVRGRIKGSVAKSVKEFIDETSEWVDTLLGIGFESRHQSVRELLGAFVRELDETYFVRKRDRSALDFIDLEELAVRLLTMEDVARETKKRYQYLLLDECQDTNGLQLSLMRLLWNAGRFFAVGDPKQSIYHFRDADIQAYLSLGQEFEEKDSLALTLSENFRSHPEIISFVNGFFQTVWSGNEALGVPYKALAPGIAAPAATDPRIEYLSVRQEDVREARQLEATLLADRLRAVHEEHRTGYGDMAILFRAGTDMPLYERALTKRNIPVVTAAGRGFFQAKEVSDLLVGLKMIDDPYDDRTVSAVLRSPLVGLGDDDFATVHLSRGRDETPLWTWIRQEDVLAQLTDDGVTRVRRFVEQFAKLRNERGRWPGHRLLDALLRESRYLDSMLLMTFPLRRRANVRKLVSLTREIDRRSDLSIHQTIRALSDYRYTRLREPESLPSDEMQAVKLLTVHGAKGMEFPLVAIADMGRHMRTGDSDALLFHKEFGVGIRTAAEDGVIYQNIREQEKSETEAEEMRLLYVAMTRAEKRLILSGSGKGKATGWLKSVEAYLTPPDEPGVITVGADKIRFLNSEPIHERKGRRVDVVQVWSDPARFGTDVETLEVEGVRTLLRGSSFTPAPSPFGRTVSQVTSSFACPRRAYLAGKYPAARQIRLETDEPFGDEESAEVRTQEDGVVGGAALGTEFHRAMERIWRGMDPARVLVGLPHEVEVWVGELLADERLLSWRHEVQLLPEYSLFAEAEGRPLRGAIDLVIPRDDGWYCIDYKTDRATAGELAERYRLALDLYRLALARVIPPESVIRTFLYAVRSREWIEVSGQSVDRASIALRDWDNHENESVRAGRPSVLCESCAFRIDCPALLIGDSGILPAE